MKRTTLSAIALCLALGLSVSNLFVGYASADEIDPALVDCYSAFKTILTSDDMKSGEITANASLYKHTLNKAAGMEKEDKTYYDNLKKFDEVYPKYENRHDAVSDAFENVLTKKDIGKTCKAALDKKRDDYNKELSAADTKLEKQLMILVEGDWMSDAAFSTQFLTSSGSVKTPDADFFNIDKWDLKILSNKYNIKLGYMTETNPDDADDVSELHSFFDLDDVLIKVKFTDGGTQDKPADDKPADKPADTPSDKPSTDKDKPGETVKDSEVDDKKGGVGAPNSGALQNNEKGGMASLVIAGVAGAVTLVAGAAVAVMHRRSQKVSFRKK